MGIVRLGVSPASSVTEYGRHDRRGQSTREAMTLAPQLKRIAEELADARRRAHELTAPLTAASWGTRPAADQWSVAECVIHLNLTSRAFLPLIGDAIAKGRELKLLFTGPYRRDFLGWFVYRITEPPAWFRIKTTAPFMPAAVEPKEAVIHGLRAA